MFFLPLYDDNPAGRRPLVVWLLMAVCIAVFVWQASLPPSEAQAAVLAFGAIPAVLFGDVSLPPEIALVPAWLSVFTSMFLHGGWLHLAGNMLYLWIFGDNVEDSMGHGRFLVFYLLCGLAAALTQAWVDPASQIPLVGASGGIAGVLGAYLVLHPRANVRVFAWIIFFIRVINVPAFIVLGVWIAGQFLAAPGAVGASGGVAYFAHIGGFVAGMALAPLFKKRGVKLFQKPRSQVFDMEALQSGSFTRAFTHGGHRR